MRKFLLTFLGMLILMSGSLAKAEVYSVSDINVALKKISKLENVRMYDFVTKGELVGNKGLTFNMNSTQYLRKVQVIDESVKSTLAEAYAIQNSAELSDSEKNAGMAKVYTKVNALLYDIDNETINFIVSIKPPVMPGLSYRKFATNFVKYYNSLDITNTDLQF